MLGGYTTDRRLARLRERASACSLCGVVSRTPGGPIQLQTFVDLRPFLYHLTDARNVPRIRRLGRLVPAATLLSASGHAELVGSRRETDLVLRLDNDLVVLRNQEPLHEANIDLHPDWTFSDLIAFLNSHVFFWPGDATGPTGLGKSFLQRYSGPSLAVLRARTSDLLAANPAQQPLFSKHNSGAARQYLGRPSPRGPNTFLRASRFSGTPSEAQETAFIEEVVLPKHTAWALNLGSAWQTLAASAG